MTLDPISIATAGYVCDEAPDDIAIAHLGYVCIVAVVDEGVRPPGGIRRELEEEDDVAVAVIVAFLTIKDGQAWY